MLVPAFEAASLVESDAALQADYSDAPREESLNSVSSVISHSELDPHRHHMHETPSSSAQRPRRTTAFDKVVTKFEEKALSWAARWLDIASGVHRLTSPNCRRRTIACAVAAVSSR